MSFLSTTLIALVLLILWLAGARLTFNLTRGTRGMSDREIAVLSFLWPVLLLALVVGWIIYQAQQLKKRWLTRSA